MEFEMMVDDQCLFTRFGDEGDTNLDLKFTPTIIYFILYQSAS